MPPSRDAHWHLALEILSAGLLFVGPVGILAQTTPIVCLSTFNWMDNSMNQNTCLVAAYLQSVCTGGQFTMTPLQPNYHYTGPYVDQSNPCQCSSVTYSVVSACGLCQNHTIIGWSEWNFNCSTAYPGVYPPGVPSGTAVPHWAFQDVTISNIFNITIAQLAGDTPESIATQPLPTASSVTSSPASTTLSQAVVPVVAGPTSPGSSGSSGSSGSGSKAVASPTQPGASSESATPSGSSGSSGGGSNIAAIVGGTVGGVVGLALIGGLIWIIVLLVKRPSHTLPSERLPNAAYTETELFDAPLRSANHT